MRFIGMEPLVRGIPYVDLGLAGHRVDIHNAAELTNFGYDFQLREFIVTWRAENPLRSAYYGAYSTARVTLIIADVTQVSFHEVEDLALPDIGVEFVELSASGIDQGTLRFVLTESGVVAVSGGSCELRWAESP